jgi:hypothetical protein
MSLSGIARSRAILKCVRMTLALAALLVLPACWVYSVEPLYEENLAHPDPDLTFEQSLVGSWLPTHPDTDCPWTLAIAAEKQVYELTTAPAPNCKSEEKSSRYVGHVIKLDNHRFFDIIPNSAEVCDLCLPLHSFFLISQENDTLALIPVDDDWLNAAIAQKSVTLPHLSAHNLTLTASSKDLKAFVRKYADDKAAFKPEPNLVFKKK